MERPIRTKKCNKCLRELPLIHFSARRQMQDGFHSSCRDCKRAFDKEYPSTKAKRTTEKERTGERAVKKAKKGISFRDASGLYGRLEK
jgi:hypothetical protein